MSSKKNLRETLLDGLEQLVRDGSNKNYWFSTRGISDAVIALNFCLPSGEFMKLKNGSLQYLINAGEQTSADTLNWMEEIWDTSIAVAAMASDPVKYSNEITRALKWIDSKYLKSHNSWNDELWETLLALNAISFLSRSIPMSQNQKNDYSGAAEWLMKMIDTPREGLLINWSSTALFILFAHSPSFPGLTEDLEVKLKEYSQHCARTIMNTPILEDDELLWTAEAWSNGLVLWALSVARPGLLGNDKLFKLTKWFRNRIAQKDLPTEDRAFACIGLYKYLEYMEISDATRIKVVEEHEKEENALLKEEIREKLQGKIAASLKARVPDFQSRPPLLTRSSHSGYYSINLNIKVINITLIILITFFLSFLTWQTQAADGKVNLLILIPIILGSLATIAQLANFTLLPKGKRNNKNLSLPNNESE